MQKLKVIQGKLEEINKDIIRIHKSKRKTNSGKEIESGLVCRVFVKETGKNTYAILRGHLDIGQNEGDICIDEALREKLNVKVNENQEYSLEFKEASRWWGWWCWAWNASDPAYQISIRIAVVLGILSIILGLAPFLLTLSSNLNCTIP